MRDKRRSCSIAQKKADLDDEPAGGPAYEVGTLATILQLLKLPDGTVKVLVEGGERARMDSLTVTDHFQAAFSLAGRRVDRHDEREDVTYSCARLFRSSKAT